MTYVMTESEAKELKNTTWARLFDTLSNHPYPGATNLTRESGGFVCFDVDGFCVAYDRGMWGVHLSDTEYPITPNFPPFGELTVRDVHAEISRVVKIGKSLHANTKVGTMPVTPVPLTPERLLLNLKANPHPNQTHLEMAGGFAYITIDTHKIAYDGERWFVCGQQITPQFAMNSLHQEIDRVFVLAQKIKDHVLGKDTKEQTTMIEETDFSGNHVFRLLYDYHYPTMKYLRLSLDGVCRFFLNGKTWRFDYDVWEVGDEKIEHNLGFAEDVTAELLHAEIDRVLNIAKQTHTETQTMTTDPTHVSIDRYRELEAELDKMTIFRDATQERVEALQQLLPLFGLGVNAPTDKAREKIDRLKSKADRAGLLSVVCRRLYDSEEIDPTILHRALDHVEDDRKALAYIGEMVGCAPHRIGDIQANVAKLQEGLTNYKAQVEGLTKRVEQMTFERDAERVGNKWLSETIEDLKRTTVKLPGEHTLRRLFNRHNTPDKYDDGTTIPTIERFLLIIENLCRNADCLERRFEELNAISTRVNTESEDAHALLDEMGIPRWTTVGNHNERYLSLSARIRSVFNTHTKV